MSIVLAWSSLLVGVVLLTWSASHLATANRGRRVPYMTRAAITPRRALLMRSGGAFFVIIGGIGVGMASLLGMWSVMVVVAAFAPGTIILMRHNRRVTGPAAG